MKRTTMEKTDWKMAQKKKTKIINKNKKPVQKVVKRQLTRLPPMRLRLVATQQLQQQAQPQAK